jgi:hypothetical protein
MIAVLDFSFKLDEIDQVFVLSLQILGRIFEVVDKDQEEVIFVRFSLNIKDIRGEIIVA